MCRLPSWRLLLVASTPIAEGRRALAGRVSHCRFTSTVYIQQTRAKLTDMHFPLPVTTLLQNKSQPHQFNAFIVKLQESFYM